MTKITLHGLTKEVIKEKLYNKLIKITEVYEIEETHLTEKRDKLFMITNKSRKNQGKKLKVLLII